MYAVQADGAPPKKSEHGRPLNHTAQSGLGNEQGRRRGIDKVGWLYTTGRILVLIRLQLRIVAAHSNDACDGPTQAASTRVERTHRFLSWRGTESAVDECISRREGTRQMTMAGNPKPLGEDASTSYQKLRHACYSLKVA